MNGILCAYFRATDPSTPSVEATALHPPSIASFTRFSGSKYIGLGANDAPAGMLDPLIDRQNRHVTGLGQPAVIDERLKAAEHARGPIRCAVDALDVVGPGQVEALLGDGLALMIEERGGFVSEDLFEIRAHDLNRHGFLPFRRHTADRF